MLTINIVGRRVNQSIKIYLPQYIIKYIETNYKQRQATREAKRLNELAADQVELKCCYNMKIFIHQRKHW